jgi:phosphohistidine phosphatase SixA
MKRRAFLLALSTLSVLPAHAAINPALLAQLRRGGNVILMRHAATVPGVGDPDGFVLGQCATQRNLSEAGRLDAVRIGAAFVHLDIPVGDVFSSRWCRCLDTAQLAFGRVTPEPRLDSLFNDDAPVKARKLGVTHQWLKTLRPQANSVMVTHDVNIRALAGPYVEQGAMVVAIIGRDGMLQVSGVWSP